MSRPIVTVEHDGEVVFAVDADCVTDFLRSRKCDDATGHWWYTVYMSSGVGRVVCAPKDFGVRLHAAIQGRR